MIVTELTALEATTTLTVACRPVIDEPIETKGIL